ncbi:hypothetical protein GLOTRDRAFT_50178, partial [Gloeophyllum trabeum ATCC 11539]
IFADMFALPPSDSNESYERRPCIQMPDSAEDLEAVLRLLYYETTLSLERLDPKTPSIVDPILSIATKYEIRVLREPIIKQLTEDWPTTLKAWDVLEKEIAVMLKAAYDDPVVFIMDDHLPEPVSAIRLAYKCGVPTILPAAFYHLSRLPMRWDRTELKTIG